MPAPSSEPWIHDVGARRGRYEVTARVARGGYGEVYAVRDEANQRWAMKLVRLAREGDRRAAQRAVVEASVLKRLHHINVVRYEEAFVDHDGAVVLITEYLVGRSLREHIARDDMTPERALRLGSQLANAAAAVHAVGAVHRDITPENVFVTAGDLVKLFDFGLVKCTGIELKTTRPVGTPRYMAPEQLAFSARPDPRWDVYAIGLVVFELLAGVHPFDVDPARAPKTGAEVVERHLAGGVPSLRAVLPAAPQPLVDALARAVDHRPDHRTASAAALAAELTGGRIAWMAAFGAIDTGITAELRQLTAADDEPEPPSLDGPTLERPHPPLAEPPRPERLVPETPASTGPFGTEPLLPHIDKNAFTARPPKPKRNA
jgi:serine/threonine-protein kinase